MKRAVDFDGTLVEWTKDDAFDPVRFGNPISPMVERIRRWMSAGDEVIILTARVYPGESGERGVDAENARQVIRDWSYVMFGRRLSVTCMKDPMIEEIWDDRAVTVERNTGNILTVGVRDDMDADSMGQFIGD